ncbi:MAG: dihydrodipicolinate synthase family protein [Betaproteobacteria bacterium]|nr:dihydrodipicolinate synthase family protein [Betaproteobacteria bacterium]
MMMISGNWATLLLPIDTDESIDFVRLEAELEALTAAGMDGVYSNGSAGEFHCQTEAEYDSVQMLLAETCEEAGTPFIIGACHTDPLVSAGRVARAAALRPSAIQVILPDWVTVTDAEAVDFMAMMRENAGGIPLVLYNPPHAKRVLSPRALRQLLDTAPDVVGVKLGDGDAAWYDEARQWLSGVALFVPGHHLATGVREGVAAGAFSNVACLSPIGAQKWTDSMTEDLEGALELESRIQRFMDDYIVPFKLKHGYCNAALDKLLAAVGGWAPVGTRLRRPYRWIDQEMVPRIRQAARDLVPELV